jgi:HD superfamily phosphohydrolase
VLHIAGRVAEQLRMNEDDAQIIRYAALLHDIGHGPFSHMFEDTLHSIITKKFTHEDVTRRIITDVPEIHDILGTTCESVLSIFDPSEKSINHQIISGMIDADKMDYLRRDSYHAGVAYGIFDLERILYTLDSHTEGRTTYLAIKEKGLDALESFRLARFLMHAQVYYHHTRVAADQMLKRAIQIAVRDQVLERDLLEIDHKNFLNYYLAFDDARLLIKLQSQKESKASELARNLESRRLFKRGFELNILTSDDFVLKEKLLKRALDLSKIERAISESVECDRDFIIADKHNIENELYSPSYKQMESDKTPLLIKKKNHTIQEIDKLSSINGEKEPRMMFYIFCPEEYRTKVAELSISIIKDNI